MPAHTVAWAALQHGQQKARGMCAGFVHVHVGVGFEADQHISMVNHLLCNVAVQVQRHANGYTGCGGAYSR